MPANSNKTLSDVMTNPHGEAVCDALASTLRLLVKSGAPDSAISEQLFALAKAYTVPRDHSDAGAIAGWHSQLLRFRDELDTQIQKIETALDKEDQH